MHILWIFFAVFVFALGQIPDGKAETIEVLREMKPELFHADTGYRLERYRAPVPDDIPDPVKVVTIFDAKTMIENGAIAIDVYGANRSQFDPLDGAWLVSAPRLSLPDAYWLPEIGRGVLDREMTDYMHAALRKLTEEDVSTPLIIFCVADCWMSWNAAQRISALGYEAVYWFPTGSDGWVEAGYALEPIWPAPIESYTTN